MGKTAERLNSYQTQMSIYAEQHKVILASDVLDMIEQLQEDLKDDVSSIVEKLEADVIHPQCSVPFRILYEDFKKRAIQIVKDGGSDEP